MKKEHLIMLLAIVGLALAGCEITDESTVNDSKISSEMGATKLDIYDSQLFDSASWNQEIERRRLSHPNYYSNVGGLTVVSYFYNKML